MNSVSHLSRINKGLSSKDSSPYQSPRHSPTALRKPSPLGHVVAASGVTLPSNGTAPPAQIPTVQVQAAETNSAASTFRRSLGW
ncbi:hypothetical protein BC829DRAFT_381629 [Chytridium lagenaria]|nr:hypothetical protein BC829DRAFT_381629 [Chytridium lagenaria]